MPSRAIVVMGVAAGACTADRDAHAQAAGSSDDGGPRASSDEAAPPADGTSDASTTLDDDNGDTTTGATADDPPIAFDLGVVPDAPGDPAEACSRAVDVVFVMDVSNSMEGFLATLADEILAVDAAIGRLGLREPASYGLVVFVDDVTAIASGAAFSDAAALQDAFAQWSVFSTTNTQTSGMGLNTTWTENSLDALHAAATEFDWRPAETTNRVVIHCTDDAFWDGPVVANGIPIEHGYADTVDALQAAQVRVFAFTDDIGGPFDGQDVSAGWSTPYMRMPPIPEATDGLRSPIDDVLTGAVSLSDALPAVVQATLCEPYEPVE